MTRASYTRQTRLALGQSFALDPPKFRFVFRSFWHPNFAKVLTEIYFRITCDAHNESRKFREKMGGGAPPGPSPDLFDFSVSGLPPAPLEGLDPGPSKQKPLPRALPPSPSDPADPADPPYKAKNQPYKGHNHVEKGSVPFCYLVHLVRRRLFQPCIFEPPKVPLA